eukprot:scaffold741_cov336-Pavlova_lutheri.AAC.10
MAQACAPPPPTNPTGRGKRPPSSLRGEDPGEAKVGEAGWRGPRGFRGGRGARRGVNTCINTGTREYYLGLGHVLVMAIPRTWKVR